MFLYKSYPYFLEIPKEKRCSVQVKQALKPIMTCFGTRISFNCSFAIDDPRFYYVVWYVGHFRVERTNHKFHVRILILFLQKVLLHCLMKKKLKYISF